MANENFDKQGQYEHYLDEYARNVVTVGTDTYYAYAEAGSSDSAAVWRAFKVDTNGTKTWADGDTNFDNVGTITGLSGLTYS